MPSKVSRICRQDSISLDKTYFTEEGYLIDEPIVTSVGIFEYHNDDGSIRRELRLPKYVFDPKSLETYMGKPIIVTHDAGVVDKDNVHQEAIGTILSPGCQNGDDVRCKIIIHDTDALKRGLRELSLGYTQESIEEPGEWQGQPYDAIQTNIEINHLALVANARAGDQARLNIDGNDKESKGDPMKKNHNDEDVAKVQEDLVATSDDETTTETSVGAENKPSPEESIKQVKDRRDRRDGSSSPTNLDEANQIIREQDDDLGALLDVIDVLSAQKDLGAASNPPDATMDECGAGSSSGSEEKKADEDTTKTTEEKAMNADSVDKIVRERMNLGRIGDRLNLDGLENMPVLAAKKVIVGKLSPKLRLDGKSETYINTAFDIAVSSMDSRKDCSYQKQQMTSGTRADSAAASSAAQARQRMIDRNMNGGNE